MPWVRSRPSWKTAGGAPGADPSTPPAAIIRKKTAFPKSALQKTVERTPFIKTHGEGGVPLHAVFFDLNQKFSTLLDSRFAAMPRIRWISPSAICNSFCNAFAYSLRSSR